MIRKAQEFMNENHYADISRVHCLLRKMMPKEYHDLIDQIKECQDPHVMFNVNGGNNVIAPNASQAKQNIHDDSSSSIKDNFQSIMIMIVSFREPVTLSQSKCLQSRLLFNTIKPCHIERSRDTYEVG